LGFTKLQILIKLTFIFFSETEGFPEADLDNLVEEAALEAMTKAGLDNVETVAKTDFKFSLRKFNAEFINKNAIW
jgi:hypothetical protein